jgi:DinB superfamily
MQKRAITQALLQKHEEFIQYTNSLTPQELLFAKADKWTAAQQVEHIYKSVRPLAQGLFLPKFIVKMIWGKANRSSKSYTELVEKYTTKLAVGGRASAPFVPKVVSVVALPSLHKKITSAVLRLNKNIEKYSEAELDLYILPHPLLGKVTLREMLYFTIYHVEQHQQIIQRDLV